MTRVLTRNLVVCSTIGFAVGALAGLAFGYWGIPVGLGVTAAVTVPLTVRAVRESGL